MIELVCYYCEVGWLVAWLVLADHVERRRRWPERMWSGLPAVVFLWPLVVATVLSPHLDRTIMAWVTSRAIRRTR